MNFTCFDKFPGILIWATKGTEKMRSEEAEKLRRKEKKFVLK
jgi:hypothetical protein